MKKILPLLFVSIVTMCCKKNNNTAVFNDCKMTSYTEDFETNYITYTDNKVSQIKSSNNKTLYIYNGANQLFRKEHYYDNASKPNKIFEYTFNSANQLTSILELKTSNSGNTYVSNGVSNYTYEGNNLVKISMDGKTTNLIWKDGNIIEEVTPAGKVVYKYTYDLTKTNKMNSNFKSFAYLKQHYDFITTPLFLSKNICTSYIDQYNDNYILAYTYNSKGSITTITEDVDFKTTYLYDCD